METAPSKLNSIKKMKEKMIELETKHNKPWMDLVREQFAKAGSETETMAQEASTEVEVTEKLWEELDMDCEKTLGEEGLKLKDLDPITQAEM